MLSNPFSKLGIASASRLGQGLMKLPDGWRAVPPCGEGPRLSWLGTAQLRLCQATSGFFLWEDLSLAAVYLNNPTLRLVPKETSQLVTVL